MNLFIDFITGRINKDFKNTVFISYIFYVKLE